MLKAPRTFTASGMSSRASTTIEARRRRSRRSERTLPTSASSTCAGPRAGKRASTRPLGGVFRRDSRRGRAARRSFAAERGGLILFRFFASKKGGFSSQTSHLKKGRGHVPTISPCQGGGFAAGCRSWPSELLIALCSDIESMLLRRPGGGMSGVPKLTARYA
jgi:hypothetical protein